jgi:hypothetical protein
MRASYWGKTDTVQLLLEAGANMQVKNMESARE